MGEERIREWGEENPVDQGDDGKREGEIPGAAVEVRRGRASLGDPGDRGEIGAGQIGGPQLDLSKFIE